MHKIPDEIMVLHRCDVPCCVNPAHLFLGTNDDNMADMVAKKRDRKARGEDSGNVKLKEADVIHIRRSGISNRELAAMYGVDTSNISRIKTRNTWAWLK